MVQERKMQQFFSDYLARLTAIHAVCFAAFADLSAEAVCWQPGSDMNSIAVLVAHMTGAERYWIGDVALGETSDRVRAEEFVPAAVDVATLKEKLDNSLAYAERALVGISLRDLESMRLSRVHDRGFTVGWALLHALEHSAQHSGHIQMTSQLWQVTHAAQ